MFVAYLATRWYQNLRSTAIFLQVYVLAVVAREAIVDFGRVSLRAIWWLQLAKYEHLKLPWSLAHQSGSELSGFLILAAVIPFLPIYPIAFALFVSYSFWRKCDVWDASLPIFWQKLGYCVYDVFLARYLLVHEDEVMGRNHRRKQSGEGHVPVSSSPANQGYFLEWTKELTRWYRLWKPRSFGTVIFYVIFFLLNSSAYNFTSYLHQLRYVRSSPSCRPKHRSSTCGVRPGLFRCTHRRSCNYRSCNWIGNSNMYPGCRFGNRCP